MFALGMVNLEQAGGRMWLLIYGYGISVHDFASDVRMRVPHRIFRVSVKSVGSMKELRYISPNIILQ